MATVVVFNSKGGVGKSTLSVHLAVAASLTGRKAIILDLDAQGSSVAWHEARGEGTEPAVLKAHAGSLERAVASAQALGYDFVLVDCPPSVSATTAKIIAVADLVAIPVRPETFDVAALPNAIKLVGDKPFVFVLSDCGLRAPEIKEAQDALLAYGRPVLGPIHSRRSMWRALVSGKAIAEVEPDSLAAQEVRAVCDSILKELTHG